MKITILALALIFAGVDRLGYGQETKHTKPQPDLVRVLGVWRAQMDGLPAFTLVVTNESGELQGAILFYLLKREKLDVPPTATAGLPEPIFHPTFDGRTLRFQVSHRRAHPPRTLNDPPVQYELTPIGDNKALVPGSFEGMTLTVTRSDF